MAKIALAIIDSFFLLAALLAAYYLRNSFEPRVHGLELYIEVFPFVLVIFYLIFWGSGLYTKQIKKQPFTEIYKVIKALSLLALILMALSFLQKFDYSRAVLVLFWLFSILFLMIDRLLFKKTGLNTTHIQDKLKGEALPNLEIHDGGFIYDYTKRLIDLVLGLFGLVFFMPLWLLIILAIKADSKGPAIFIHERVGRNGKKFRLYKFRTMRADANREAPAPLSINDKRITRFGKLLRKTSLDEAPQFINVLKGEMSVVGPRPEMPFIVENYEIWQRKRLEVKPGITGLWQVLGRKDIPLKDNLEYDFYYIKNRSLLLDIVILIRTVGIVLTGKGAY